MISDGIFTTRHLVKTRCVGI